jgi:hypothetical protein
MLCGKCDSAKCHKIHTPDRFVKMHAASSGDVPNDRPKRIDCTAPQNDVLPCGGQLSSFQPSSSARYVEKAGGVAAAKIFEGSGQLDICARLASSTPKLGIVSSRR